MLNGRAAVGLGGIGGLLFVVLFVPSYLSAPDTPSPPRVPRRYRLLHRQAGRNPNPQRAAPHLRRLLLPRVPWCAAQRAEGRRGRGVRLLVRLAGRGTAVHNLGTSGGSGRDCLPGDPSSV